ncbi:MAG: hypothetical protein DRH04_01455 [Deltaproteobacteria bacterium]|nr:MAG: hypothetical protein DRH04_01455 [Deltaproteobacteria bacterium]
MKLQLPGKAKYEAEIAVLCNRGIFSDHPDKIGAVRIYGGDGRAVLSMVEQARMLFDEYPEDCVSLGTAGVVVVEENGRKSQVADAIFCLAKGDGFSLLATSVDPDATRDLLGRLQRYATRLVRIDVP